MKAEDRIRIGNQIRAILLKRDKKPVDHQGRPFSQLTPAHQVGNLIMSLEGNYLNFKEGIISKDKMLDCLDSHLKDMAILNPFLYENKWPE